MQEQISVNTSSIDLKVEKHVCALLGSHRRFRSVNMYKPDGQSVSRLVEIDNWISCFFFFFISWNVCSFDKDLFLLCRQGRQKGGVRREVKPGASQSHGT